MANPPSDKLQQRVIPSEAAEAVSLIGELVGHLRQAGWDEHELFGMHMALEEALMNGIKHGNAGDPSKRVTVRWSIETGGFWVEITDEGEGFDRSEVPDPTDEENLDKPSGRGLMLMEYYMTTVHYNDVGNRVVMHKLRSVPSGLDESSSEQD